MVRSQQQQQRQWEQQRWEQRGRKEVMRNSRRELAKQQQAAAKQQPSSSYQTHQKEPRSAAAGERKVGIVQVPLSPSPHRQGELKAQIMPVKLKIQGQAKAQSE
jgi:hypothetical protein